MQLGIDIERRTHLSARSGLTTHAQRSRRSRWHLALIMAVAVEVSLGASFAMEARLTDDTFASEKAPTAHLGARPMLQVSSRPASNTYIKFDLSGLPAGATGNDVAK